MQILLYTYCKTFNISPNEAQHTPLSLLLDMLLIHGEAEKMKAEELDNMKRRVNSGG